MRDVFAFLANLEHAAMSLLVDCQYSSGIPKRSSYGVPFEISNRILVDSEQKNDDKLRELLL
jgi:hypothetical protein